MSYQDRTKGNDSATNPSRVATTTQYVTWIILVTPATTIQLYAQPQAIGDTTKVNMSMALATTISVPANTIEHH